MITLFTHISFKTCKMCLTFKSVYFLLFISYISCENVVVITTHGQVSGVTLKTLLQKKEYNAFMGIPYAVPPINELRFKPPKPIEPWMVILDASKEKKPCPYHNHHIGKGEIFELRGAEDCLYLDIFTPSADNKKRAVIVFLYNEIFTASYEKTKDYAPDFFIEEDVVVVTISYRLSALGFLTLEDENLPPNSGFKDLILGLEWVKNNIGRFGGDPGKITLMGSQGGAAAAELLLYSKAKDWIQSLILQSGSSWSSAYLQENLRQRFFKLGERLEIPASSGNQLLKDLQEGDVKEILTKELHASPDDYFKEEQKSVLAFSPMVDNNMSDGVLPEYPEDFTGKIDIPVMMGYNSREGLGPCVEYLMEPRFMPFLQKDFPLIMPRRLRFKFDPLNDAFFDAIDEVKSFYYPKGKVTMKNIPEHMTYLGDVITGYVLDYTARVYANRSSAPVYFYHFDYFSDLNENKNSIMKFVKTEEGTWGAMTGDELCYLFKCPSLKHKYEKFNEYKTEEIMIQKKMVRMWTNFAKYGNPTPDGDELLDGLKWPSYNLDTKNYLNIGKEFTAKEHLNKERIQFWDDSLSRWESRAVDGVIRDAKIKRDEL